MIVETLIFIFSYLIRLRYRVTVRGLEKICTSKGMLVLPNHPAEIDPVVLTVVLRRYIKLRPVVLERYYMMLLWFFSRLGAVPMPDMEIEGGFYKRQRVQDSVQSILSVLRQGGAILMYPSGRLMTSGFERLGGTSGAYTLLKQEPRTNVVLVRTTGLYGSAFSKAFTGNVAPDLGKAFKQSFLYLLKNLIFFMPKRAVTIDLEEVPADDLLKLDQVQFNRHLEEWYNRDAVAEPKLVRRLFWSQELPKLPKVEVRVQEEIQVAPELRDLIFNHLSKISRVPVERLNMQTSLGDDLGIDSLQMSELIVWLNDELGVSNVELSELRDIGSLLKVATGKGGKKKSKSAASQMDSKWAEARGSRPAVEVPANNDIGACFLLTAKRMGNALMGADDASGILAWPDFLAATLIISAKIKELEGEKVGILLPASLGATIVTMACILAKKVPVLLNWTAGPAHLAQALEAAQIARVISAGRVLDGIQVDLKLPSEKLVMLEDLRSRITLADKLRGKFQTLLPAAVLTEKLGLVNVDPNSTAAILFTSGSESKPKGVPLSHLNLISNLRACLQAVDLDQDDIIYGFLPPFHSFGLVLSTILPCVSGLKIAFHPNPNEGHKIAAGCRRWGITLFAGTPAFIRNILQSGEGSDFNSVRMIISGADRLTEDVIKSKNERALQARLIEGYGITECSPVVTVNRPTDRPVGVGLPLSGVELKIVHPETLTDLPEGVQGLILIRGPNVFSGYLGGAPDPFVTVNGTRWYNSGDLGRLQSGRLIISGRMKRFVKVGGEMVSLPAIEDLLKRRWPPLTELPNLVIVPLEHIENERPDLVLFTTEAQITLPLANETILAGGMPAFTKLSKVQMVEEIPLLGSGKPDFQQLKTQAANSL